MGTIIKIWGFQVVEIGSQNIGPTLVNSAPVLSHNSFSPASLVSSLSCKDEYGMVMELEKVYITKLYGHVAQHFTRV